MLIGMVLAAVSGGDQRWRIAAALDAVGGRDRGRVGSVPVKYDCQKRRWVFDWRGVSEFEARKHGYVGGLLRAEPVHVEFDPAAADAAFARRHEERLWCSWPRRRPPSSPRRLRAACVQGAAASQGKAYTSHAYAGSIGQRSRLVGRRSARR